MYNAQLRSYIPPKIDLGSKATDLHKLLVGLDSREARARFNLVCMAAARVGIKVCRPSAHVFSTHPPSFLLQMGPNQIPFEPCMFLAWLQ
jgi:hypothetical protein